MSFLVKTKRGISCACKSSVGQQTQKKMSAYNDAIFWIGSIEAGSKGMREGEDRHIWTECIVVYADFEEKRGGGICFKTKLNFHFKSTSFQVQMGFKVSLEKSAPCQQTLALCVEWEVYKQRCPVESELEHSIQQSIWFISIWIYKRYWAGYKLPSLS